VDLGFKYLQPAVGAKNFSFRVVKPPGKESS
jgi:hypothetical protein